MQTRILVDTDVFSYLVGNRPELKPFRPLLEGRQICLSFITHGEMFYGAWKRHWGDARIESLRKALGQVVRLPYDDDMPEVYGRLVADCQSRGHQVKVNDAWIAATALAYGIPLVTNNRRDFAPVRDLEIL